MDKIILAVVISAAFALAGCSKEAGPAGPPGEKGAQGPTGPQGAQGIQGIPGAQGRKALQGRKVLRVPLDRKARKGCKAFPVHRER